MFAPFDINIYSAWQRFQYRSGNRARPFVSRNMEFVPVLWASSSEMQPLKENDIITVDHAGEKVRGTSLERTMVDVLHVPEKGGG
jgi:hypothetical protein